MALVSADDVTSVVHGIGVTPRADGGAHPRSVDDVLASGIGVSPGVGVGLVCHTTNEALDAWDAGDEVVLFVSETHPADEPAMRVVAAIPSPVGVARRVTRRLWRVTSGSRLCAGSATSPSMAGGR